MEVQVQQLRVGDFSVEIASLVADRDGAFFRTFDRRILLPAGGLSDVHEEPVECFRHFGDLDTCRDGRDNSAMEHLPEPGWAFLAKDSRGSRLTFAVQDRERARLVLDQAAGAPGPGAVVMWRAPSSWFRRSVIGLGLVAAVLLLGISVWDSLHLELVSATVTDNALDGGGRVCSLAWHDPGGTPEVVEELACSQADEPGSEIAVWSSPFWRSADEFALWAWLRCGTADACDSADAELFPLVAKSALLKPLAVIQLLGCAMFVLWLPLQVVFEPLETALDKRRLRRASSGATPTVSRVAS